jgi:hypothetical protein
MKTIIAVTTVLVSWATLATVLTGPAAMASAAAPAGVAAPAAALAQTGVAAPVAVGGVVTPGAAAAARRPVAFDCDGWRRGLVRMREFDVTCDASVVVTTKGWKYWTGTSARSRGGKLWVNTCQPNCAAGNYRTYPGTVVFYRVRWHRGVRYFSRMRLRYRHGRLRGYVYHWARYPGASQPVWLGGP